MAVNWQVPLSLSLLLVPDSVLDARRVACKGDVPFFWAHLQWLAGVQLLHSSQPGQGDTELKNTWHKPDNI